jgi:alkylation response protein AidB-like acyl-CoA dehydrogenase
VTRFHEVRVPAVNRIGAEGQGLKIALATLNTGRLSLPATCAAAGKLACKVAREWSQVRVQWGRPVGEPGPSKLENVHRHIRWRGGPANQDQTN